MTTNTPVPPQSGDHTYGYFLPRYVLDCPGLKPHDWVAIAQIIGLSRSPRGCFATLEYLAGDVRFNRSSLVRIQKRLRERGLVVREGRTLRTPPPDDPIWKQPPPEEVKPARKARRKIERPRANTPSCSSNALTAPPPPAPSQSLVPSSQTPSPAPRTQPPVPRQRRTTPLEDKLVEICQLGPLVGTKTFPGSLFGKCLAHLVELGATPEELGRYVPWWAEQAMGYRKPCPTLQQVMTTFHNARLARFIPGAAPGRPSAAAQPGRRVDPGAMSLTDPEKFNALHPVRPESAEEARRFSGWRALGKSIDECFRLAEQGAEPPAGEAMTN